MDERLLVDIEDCPEMGRYFGCRLIDQPRICLDSLSYLKVWWLKLDHALTRGEEEVILRL